jgi:hypothetical protein
MIDRKRKLRLIQFFLLVVGISIIYFAYYNLEEDKSLKIISETTSKKLEKQNKEESLNDGDVFFDVEYTGLDLNGNRYILKSKEAYLDQDKTEIIYMKTVVATFYFKDDTVLYVWSNKGIYNNKTLDMKFDENVKANYFDSELFADKAEYSNSKSYLSIYENVKINDKRGDLIADKLLFDITKQKLNITSFNNGKINANVKLNEKRF